MANLTKAELRDGGLLSRWEAAANKYDTLNDQLTDPAVLAQSSLLVSLSKERAELEPIAHMFGEHRQVLEEIVQAKIMAEDQQLDADMRRLACEELESLESRRDTLEVRVRFRRMRRGHPEPIIRNPIRNGLAIAMPTKASKHQEL